MRKVLSIVAGLALLGALSGCAALSSPITQREQTAGIGGLAGGAAGAIIGSFTGSAVAGGLFGIPLGAVAGYFIGDQMSRDREAQSEKTTELARLREENERLKRSAPSVEDEMPRAAQAKAVVWFEFDQSSLPDRAAQVLDPMIAWLKEDSEHSATVFGYTDSVGSAEYNKNLSQRRARAVRDYIVESGVEARNLEIYGMGETNPIASNDTAAGRQQNRRVEVVPNGTRTASAK